MADVLKSVAIIFEGQDKLSPQVDKVEQALAGVGNEAGAASGKVGALTGELEKTGSSTAGIDKATTALKTLAASLIVKDFIDANIAFEQFVKTMTVATGDAGAAAAEFDYVRAVSNRLGIEVRTTAESYAQFASATKGTALEGEGARQVFEAFAGTMSRVGASSADVNGAFVQLAQGVSKGRFELEDLKSIAERVPGFFTSFSDALGVTTAELYDLISAGEIGGDEIQRFAAKLNESLEGVDFNGFTNEVARFKNATNDAYLVIGEAGAFDVLTFGVEKGGKGVAALAGGLAYLKDVAGAALDGLSTGSIDVFNAGLARAEAKAADAADAISGELNQSVAETARLLRAAADASKDVAQSSEDLATQIINQAAESSKAVAEVDKILKGLGVDPAKLKTNLNEITALFDKLSENAAATGEQITQGLDGALKKIKGGAGFEEYAKLGESLADAFKRGALTAEEYAAAAGMVAKAAAGLEDPLKKAQQGTDDTAKATREAEEAARDYALEMEKLASNERIKLIEARVALNVAQVEADTERIKSAFDSINVTIDSTGSLLDDLFGLLGNYDSLNWNAIRTIEEQIEMENRRRQEALDIQKKLIEAQIQNLDAQTRALEKGDALIQVDGTGLQPHLEAFMWEILKSIQVRVNQDGLQQLLGL